MQGVEHVQRQEVPVRQATLAGLGGNVRVMGEGDALLVHAPWNPHFTEALKATIPATERKWLPERKLWAVSQKRGHQLKDLLEEHYGATVTLPKAHTPAKPAVRLLQCRYIGQVKERGAGDESALGWDGTDWAIVFPKAVLMTWFGAEQRPGEALSLYAVLGVQARASAEEIRKAYKRAAMQWHPDRCREPDAAEQFRAIQEAYQLLNDAGRRARYDAGLALAGRVSERAETRVAAAYRPPLRCGWVLAEGSESLGRFTASRILQWEMITDLQGRELVTSWPMGAKQPNESWVMP